MSQNDEKNTTCSAQISLNSWNIKIKNIVKQDTFIEYNSVFFVCVDYCVSNMHRKLT